METKNVIRTHLHLNSAEDENGQIAESSLVHALRNIRLITGRNQDTGAAIPGGYLGNWIGAIGYITILDQIGKCYRPNCKNKITDNRSPIKKALAYFTKLSDNEIDAVYALRNAFHHDFSLLNIFPGNNYHFAVNQHATNPIVILPPVKCEWDGNIANRNNNNQTYNNLQALGDLVEDIYTQILLLEESGNLLLDLDGGEDALQARYIFYH